MSVPVHRAAPTGTAAKLRSLLTIAAAVGASRRFADVLELAAEEACAALGAASLSISRWERDEGLLRTLINVGELGPDEERFPSNEVYRLEDYSRSVAMMLRGECWTRSIDDPPFPDHIDLLHRLGKESEAAVPIMFEGEVWGELYATTSPGQPRMTDADIEFMRAVASHVAAGLASAEYLGRLETLAFTDPLTGLANRRGLDEHLDQALADANLDQRPVSLVVCDVDGLKQVNDREGHASGDAALVLVGDALREAIGTVPGGIAARIGGDEFCLLLAGSDARAAQEVTQAALDLLADHGPGTVTISAGIATTFAARDGTELFRAADAAQYEAKHHGAGSIRIAPALSNLRGLLDGSLEPESQPGHRPRRQLRDVAATDIARLLADVSEQAGPPDLVTRVLAAAREHLDCTLDFVRGDQVDDDVGRPGGVSNPADGKVLVPVVLRDGRVYGAFQCSRPSRLPEPGELRYLHLLAALVAGAVENDAAQATDRHETRRRIAQLLDTGALRVVFQPLLDLRQGRTIGVEALTRFRTTVTRPPDLWFAEAAEVGLGIDLELAALRAALAELPRLDAGLFLSVNLSPEALCSPRLPPLVADHATRLVLEITEHAPVRDYRKLHEALRVLRAAGIRLAVDDAGAGYASFAHILRLAPEIIKLDLQLTRGIDKDPVRRALASALCSFAEGMGALIVAEGIETAGEVAALQALGIVHGQGFHVGRPGPAALPDPRMGGS